MQVKHIGEDRRHEWNAFVAQEPSFALLQSWGWGEFKEKLGWKVFRVAMEKHRQISAAAQMFIRPMPLGSRSVAYVPRGPVGNWLDEMIAPRLLSELRRVAQENGAIFLKVEPPLLDAFNAHLILQRYQFRPSHYTNQPRATIVMDLTPDLDGILRQMRKKTRQYIRYATRKGVTIRVAGQEDLPAFYDLMRMTAKRCKFRPRIRSYYEHLWQVFAEKDQAVLLMAYFQDELLAARTVFQFGSHAAEFHAGALSDNRDVHPDYLLIWEAIKWAKARGCRSYDLWGIPDEVGQAVSGGKDLPQSDRRNGLWGVYQFKRGFSKNVVFHTAAHDYVYSPLLYALVTNQALNGDMLDQMAVWMDALRQS